MKKKLLFFAYALMITGLAKAQNSDCMPFFPENPGATLITKNYNAKNKLQHTITYKVLDTSDSFNQENAGVGFVVTDKKGVAIDQGNIQVECNDGTFFLKMVNRAMSPDIMDMLGTDTNLVGEFLDYPNTFTDSPFDGNFKMSSGEYTIESKEDKDLKMNVRVYNRQYEKNEKITTPAGTFNAAKITFYFDVYKDKKTVTYKGVEWYALRAGIVRSETYLNDKLLNYTVLNSRTK